MQTIEELWGEQGERMQTVAACTQFDTLLADNSVGTLVVGCDDDDADAHTAA